MRNIEIVTTNAAYENGKCIGGYHEIHEINFLQNMPHLFATIDYILVNNLLYGCDNTELEKITVICEEQSILDLVNEHYKGELLGIKIVTELKI